jgi:membrane-associated phospholipid phosphatase
VRRRRGPANPHEDWTTEASSGLALAGFLALVFVAFTLLAMGPLHGLDTYFNLATPPKAWVPVLHVMDRIGQRAVCLPILGLAAFAACRRQQSWRPAVLAVLSVLALNFVVGVLKLSFGRAEPETGNPAFFAGGMAYPSGHTSNIVLVYGLAAYLLVRYTRVPRRAVGVLWALVALLSVTMVVTSLTLTWHWFADLIGGLIIGSMVLQLTASVDHMVTDEVYDQQVRPLLRRLIFWRRQPEPPPATREDAPHGA